MCIKERYEKQRGTQHEESSAVVMRILREEDLSSKSVKRRTV